MIRKWLINHWWANETGKVLCAAAFGYFAWVAYSSGQMPGAFISGIFFVACMVIVCDTAIVLIKKARGEPLYEGE